MFRFIYYFTKTIKNCFNFLFVKRLTLACLVKTSITHNKYLTCQFLEDNNPISAKSATQNYV